MSVFMQGMLEWSLDRDKDGHRTYNAKWLLGTTDPEDGPKQVLDCPDLAGIGSPWEYGNDSDLAAYCLPTVRIAPVYNNEKCSWWTAEQSFSTNTSNSKRCQDESIENPLDEPPDISGSFIKLTKQAARDKDGNAIRSSSLERIKGAVLERDFNRPTVSIVQNLLSLPMADFAPRVDAINDSPMWDLDEFMVKLSNVSWQRLVYGTCSFYYRVSYEFEINYDTWIYKIPDRGTRILRDGGDPLDQLDYKAYKDSRGENGECFLDGAGGVLGSGLDPVLLEKHLYQEMDLLALGIPSVLSA